MLVTNIFVTLKKYAFLEKSIREISDSRFQQLRQISAKENASLNKQTHLFIKIKKKRAAQSSHDKDEFQRLSREIEKDSVALAVQKNSKVLF